MIVKYFAQNVIKNFIHKQTLIVRWPDILIIYINKDIDNIYYDNYIIFPNKLDLVGCVKQDIYNLISLIEYLGTEFGEHYKWKCYIFIDKNCNDSIVHEINIQNYKENFIKSRNIIILFYQRDNK